MSNLDEYINKIKKYIESNPGITEDEIIRYVYIDLGKKFAFDLNFAFGNRKEKEKIYFTQDTKEFLNKKMEDDFITCKSLSAILEYILKSFNINIQMQYEESVLTRYEHVCNVIKPKDGRPKYIIDLQQDLSSIQSRSFTKNYGLSLNRKKQIIPRLEQEKIDRKIGYIDNEHYYSDDYIYLLKSDIGFIEDFDEKTRFVLENIDIHENKKTQYAERKWHHEEMIESLFSLKELRNITILDCYEENNGVKKYINCVCVYANKTIHVYIYNDEKFKYEEYDLYEFAKKIKNGEIHSKQEIMGFKKIIKEMEKDQEHDI